MKSIKFIFLTVAICIASVALILQSCNSNENEVSLANPQNYMLTNNQYEYLNVPKIYQEIGQFHNESLDTIFTEMNNKLFSTSARACTKGILQKNKSNIQSFDFNSIIKNALEKYSNSKTRTKNENSVKLAISRVKKNLIRNSSDSTIVVKDLNPSQKEFVAKIRKVLNAECQSENLKGLKEKLDNINKEAEKRLSKEDASSIYAATSVAFNSYQYWRRNINKWAGLFDAFGIGNEKCKELNVSGVKTKSKSKRFKADYFELHDGSYLLPEVTCYSYSVWDTTILPIIESDCSAAAGQMTVALAHAAYIELISGGTATPIAIGDFVLETAISAGGASGYTAIGILTGWW